MESQGSSDSEEPKTESVAEKQKQTSFKTGVHAPTCFDATFAFQVKKIVFLQKMLNRTNYVTIGNWPMGQNGLRFKMGPGPGPR